MTAQGANLNILQHQRQRDRSAHRARNFTKQIDTSDARAVETLIDGLKQLLQPNYG